MNNLKRVSPQGRHFFFGYYDKTPWNETEDKLLGMEAGFKNRMPTEDDYLTIGWFDLQNDCKWHPAGNTNTWNFQQGCMLQWIGEDRFIYNAKNDNDERVARVQDTNGNILKELTSHIYSISHNKNYAMVIDFGRLHQYRPGYGYAGVKEVIPNDEDGIFRLNLNNGYRELVVPYSHFVTEGYVPVNSSFWIDHILFSPDDEKIAFLLRHLTDDGGMYSRVFVADIQGSAVECILNTGMAGHADWYDSNTFAVWGRKKNIVKTIQNNAFLKKIARKLITRVRRRGVSPMVRNAVYGDCFLMVDITKKIVWKFAQNIPTRDGGGHFSFDKTGNLMLNDTGIDDKGYRALMLYELNEGKRRDIETCYIDPDIHYTPWRCDLHPRWSPNDDFICVDSIHEGFRGIYILESKKGVLE
ncbi:hypothetical protein AKJ60_00060 [candidate division MSBL1 archaeon SCGC-AAA385M11]|nr:hypothetical protein AKJ60_00060 [candidate division MSBL1 archaeon SCGC-AAA385M11]